jgi:hypothetical protein
MTLLEKIETSFKASLRGEETIDNLIYYWGITAYLFSYFVTDSIIKFNNIRFIDVTLSALTVSYFVWHIYAMKKCAPKKPQLTKEEKQAIRAEKRRELGKKILRKLLLQEPISKTNPAFITIVVDLFSIAVFLSYIIN